MGDEFFRWIKGEIIQLSPHFSTLEFACQCIHPECSSQVISKALIDKLQKVRELLGESIHITSGFRCRAHQAELSARGCETAKGTSQHELGVAADIVSSDLSALARVVEQEFLAIGYSQRFFHVDLRSDKKRYWTYKT